MTLAGRGGCGPSPTSSRGWKKKPIQAGLGLVSGGGPLSRRRRSLGAGWLGRLEPGLPQARVGGRAGEPGVRRGLVITLPPLQEFLTGTYAGGRQVMNEAEQSAHARLGKASVVYFALAGDALGWLVGEQVAWPVGGAGGLDAVAGDTYGVPTGRGLVLPQEGPNAPFTEKELRPRQGLLSGCPLRPCQAASLWLSVPSPPPSALAPGTAPLPPGAPPMAPLLSTSQSFPKPCLF